MTQREIIDELTDLAHKSGTTDNHKMTACLYFLSSIFVQKLENQACEALSPISNQANANTEKIPEWPTFLD